LTAPTPSAEQFGEFGSYRRLFLTQLLEPGDGSEARQSSQLLLVQICHE
jgi:hypothetical protein